MEDNTKIEEILENAFREMRKRYSDIMELSCSIREKKNDLKDLIYLLDVRGQVITQINQIQETISPIMEALQKKGNIGIKELCEGNSKIGFLRDDIADMIKAVSTIDQEITEFMKEKQNELKDEINKIKNTKKVNKAYKSSKDKKEGKLIDSKR
ncbi:MAG: hypothetical protein C0601_02525 [Candidatus Muiribacterium halophilum]|uniref:Flagellar protein FlgN n=1 Tax=Muiribacterium halophilum TaxID=2053465 RepID=A0A2N5ZKR0_MUIH1|nr:MAG: hypothetical protein C0601_02525 [Candidatus Muirbacterium halophilum]